MTTLRILLAALFGSFGGVGATATEVPALMQLEKFVVNGRAINSFGFDIHTYVNAENKIHLMLIGQIAEGGSAFGRDLQPGDEIVKINGRPVRDFDRLVSPQSELGKLLLNRRPGDMLELEIIKRRPAKVTLRIDTPVKIEPSFGSR